MMETPWSHSQIAMKSLYDSLAEKSNLRCLGMYYYGSREVTTNKYAAKTPAELKGCKLRVPDSEMAMAYGAALGATPVVMSLGEVYMGIQQGVVDGGEPAPDNQLQRILRGLRQPVNDRPCNRSSYIHDG